MILLRWLLSSYILGDGYYKKNIPHSVLYIGNLLYKSYSFNKHIRQKITLFYFFFIS